MTAGLRMTAEDVLTTTFDIGHEEMVLVRDIEFWSMCEHHLVPFTGVAHVGYIPAASGKITGISKLARLVDVYAKRPQVQERLTTQIADSLMEILEARGVIVVLDAEHLCMTMRGVKKAGARTITSAVRGLMLTSVDHARRGDGADQPLDTPRASARDHDDARWLSTLVSFGPGTMATLAGYLPRELRPRDRGDARSASRASQSPWPPRPIAGRARFARNARCARGSTTGPEGVAEVVDRGGEEVGDARS